MIDKPNSRIPLTIVKSESIKLGQYTFLLNKEYKGVQYKTELIGENGNGFVYRSYIQENNDIIKEMIISKVILQEFYPVDWCDIKRDENTGRIEGIDYYEEDEDFIRKKSDFFTSFKQHIDRHNDENYNFYSTAPLNLIEDNGTCYMFFDYKVYHKGYFDNNSNIMVGQDIHMEKLTEELQVEKINDRTNDNENLRISLTTVNSDIINLGPYTVLLNKEYKGVQYKTELIGEGGTGLVYRSYIQEYNNVINELVVSKVVLKEFYPVDMYDANRNELTGELSGIDYYETDDIYIKKRKRFIDSFKLFKELHNDEIVNNYTVTALNLFEANGTYYIILDYNNIQDLSEYIDNEKISLYDFLDILRNVANAINELHNLKAGGYLHLDVTPANIAIYKGSKMVCLVDSDSMVKRKEIERLKDHREEREEYEDEIIFSNSQGYSGPEMYMGIKAKLECLFECGPAADVFSVGAILYRYLFGKRIEFTDGYSLVRAKVISELQEYAYKSDLEKRVKEKYKYASTPALNLIDKFMEKCLASNIYDRYQDMDEVIDALEKIKKLVEPQKVYIQDNFKKNSNKVFGRTAKLKELTEKLQGDGTEGKENRNHLVCISAIGGMGKSTLAKLYAEENMDKYETIVEVWAENARDALLAINIVKDEEANATRKEAFKDNDKFEQWKATVSDTMCASKTLLIVHDYYLNKMGGRDDSAIWDELPCDIILTSRDMYDKTNQTVVLKFGDLINDDSNAAVDMFNMFFLENAKDEEEEELRGLVKEEEIRKLTELLSYHPFAIKVMAKQMAAGEYTSERMLIEFKEEGLKEHGDASFINSERSHEFGELDAYGHIRKIFDIVARDGILCDKEKEILRYMILVPSVDGISVNRLMEWCGFDESVRGDLKKLEQKGWIERVKGGKDYLLNDVGVITKIYRMPMVIAEALKEQDGVMPTVSNAEKYIDKFMNIELNSGINWDMRQYILNINIFMERYLCEEESKKYSNILTRIGNVLSDIEPNKAQRVHKKALDVRKKIYGDRDCNTAISYSNLALAYTQTGEYLNAIMCFEEELKIWRQDIRKREGYIASCYNNMGRVYMDLLEYNKALVFIKKALNIYEKKSDKQSVAICCGNIGIIYGVWEENEKALEYLEKALSIWNSISNYQKVAETYINVGNIYRITGNYKKASEYLLNGKEQLEKMLGEKHLATITVNANLAGLYNDEKNYELALSLYEHVLDGYKELLGEKHPSTARAYYNLGMVCANMENYEKAVEYCESAINLFKRCFGEKSDKVLEKQQVLLRIKKLLEEGSDGISC